MDDSPPLLIKASNLKKAWSVGKHSVIIIDREICKRLGITEGNGTLGMSVDIGYTQGLEISPQNYLLALENQLKPSYQDYNLLDEPSNSDDVYGFPTVSNTLDFTNHLGESGRTMNVLAVINGQGSFMFSYSNSIEAFYEYLPTVNQIIKSVVILK